MSSSHSSPPDPHGARAADLARVAARGRIDAVRVELERLAGAARSAASSSGPSAGSAVHAEAWELAASMLDATLASMSVSRSTERPLVDAEPGSADEAFAAVAALADLRTRITALEDQAMLRARDLVRADNAARGAAGRGLEHGLVLNLALARRTSAHRTGRDLAAARRRHTSMPALHRAQAGARLGEETVAAVDAAVANASPQTCARVDRELGRDLSRLDGLGTAKVGELVRGIIHQHTPPQELRDQAERAARGRYVRMRPLPHGMARLSAVLPGLDAAKMDATLQAAAESERAAGSRIALGALRADVLAEAVHRFYDQHAHLDPDELCAPLSASEVDADAAAGLEAELAAAADLTGTRPVGRPAGQPGHGAFGPLGAATGFDLVSGGWRRRLRVPDGAPLGPRVEIGIVVTDRFLEGREDDRELATLTGYGQLPVAVLRAHLEGRPYGHQIDDADLTPQEQDAAAEAAIANTFYRVLYRHPASGELMAMQSRSRAFPLNLRRLVFWRDQVCRTPWCNAVTRHVDHVQRHADGGPTSYRNAQGVCIRSNHGKEEGDWTTTLVGDPRDPAGTRIRWRSRYGVTGTSRTSAFAPLPGLNRRRRRALRAQRHRRARREGPAGR
ncbi:hypothetical protein [Brachybacterium hainanense]|uniref:HNH nuclease domain-containing protein n=1 Tax=Brachybacterium hainanense TaxID=1541174 RepID=A0ABV6RDC0_9MICO